MPDLEKVIKALEYCTHSDDCLGCIHWQKVAKGEKCTVREDALDLLKEQENVCGRNGIVVTPDWFCADGERRE